MKLFLLLLFASTAWASVPCGTRVTAQAGDQGRFKRLIIGGTRINATKWPWHIQFRVPRYGHWCGGTVISDSWILTAAHCFDIFPAEAMKVYAGTQFNMTTEKEDVAVRVIADLIRHEEYEKYTMINDIALVKLVTPLTNDDAVSPICLPNALQIIPHDGQVVAVGFGYSNERQAKGKIIKDAKLQETIIPIVPTEICREKLLATNNEFYLNVTYWDNLVCAGAIGHGAAKGDSGGPLMMKATDGRWFEIGITSFGENDAESLIRADKFPGAFTDVRKYCDWITNTTRGEASCQDELVHMQDVEIHV